MAIRWDKLTVKAQEAVQAASQLAGEHGNPELLPIHLLVELTEDREGVVAPVLSKIGADAQTVASEARAEINRLPKVSGASAEPRLSNAAQKLLDLGFEAGLIPHRTTVEVVS